MGGKGGGGGDMRWQKQAYDNAYSALERGVNPNALMSSAGNYSEAFGYAIQDYKASKPMHIPAIEIPAMHYPSSDAPSYEQQMADADARYQQQLADAERAQGIAQRDDLYSSYMNAANTATDYITGEITDEQANANLLGIEYAVTDEQRQQRMSDYFASVWSEGDQMRLEGLMKKWGNPEGFSGFSLTRGDASKYASKGKSEQKSVGQSKGIKPTLATDDEEETLGSTNSVLGG